MKSDFSVLIVDDDRALCRQLGALLAEQGYRVECLSGEEKPHLAVRRVRPDLLVLDVSVPGSGLETLHRLKLHGATRDIPVIVISAESALEFELVDVLDFLPKPLDAARLLEGVAHARARARGERGGPSALSPEELALFRDYLQRHSGLHFDRGNVKILERGLARRMRALNLDNYSDYHVYLRTYAESRRELIKLLGLLTVGETYFFRYLPHFEALRRSIVPRLVKEKGASRSLRIWSAGCSTGEEPYSLAMLLAEHFPQLQGWEIEILGTDINAASLEAARRGIYRPRSLRVTDPLYKDRYFHPVGGAYRVDDTIRAMVRFAHLNLQTGDYPSQETGTEGIDLLFCRNVMIYFRAETVRRIVEKFSRALAPGGFLFLGHAETLAQVSESFVRESKGEGFCYRLKRAQEEGEGRSDAPPLPQAPPAPRLPPAAPRVEGALLPAPPRRTALPAPAEPRIEALYAQAKAAFEAEEFSRAAELYERILDIDPRHAGALTGRGFVLANRGDYPQALRCCRRALEIDDLLVDAYFLQGIVYEATGHADEAVRDLQRALLLRSDFIMARYALSRLYRRLAKAEDARRELNNALRLLEKAPSQTLVPHSGGLSRELFIEICREGLETQEMKK